MGRFNAKAYSPAMDSSFDLVNQAKQDNLVHIDRTSGKGVEDEAMLCHCGCGQPTQGNKSMFRMGHDSRFKGILLRAHLTDTEIAVHTSGQISYFKPIELAAQYNTERYSWTGALHAAQDRAITSTRTGDGTSKSGPQVGAPHLVKVGRWEYTGTIKKVAKDGLHIEYTNGKGEVKSITVPASAK